MNGEEMVGPVPPFVWPDPRVLSGRWSGPGTVLEPLAYSAETLYGTVSGVDAHGVQWLGRLLESRRELKGRLLLALYPACPTRRHELVRLLELQRFCKASLHFRVLVAGLADSRPGNALCCVMPDGQSFLIAGVAPNFGLAAPWAGEVSTAVSCDVALLNSWNNWFDYVWGISAPLEPSTIDIPHLVPAQGDPAAGAEWQAYLLRCTQVAASQGTGKGRVEVDPETGATTVISDDGLTLMTASQELGVPAGDELAERIARLLQSGDMVTVDKNSRLRPLDAPIQPEWFGVSSFRQVGRMSRELRCRISAIDDADLREIEGKRKMVGRLLEVLSYPLSDGVRWMPHRAKPLFQREMDRVNGEGMMRLKELVKGDPGAYVDSQRDKIIDDASGMYREFHGADHHTSVPAHVVEDIVQKLKDRLSEAVSGKRLLPTVTFSSVGFRPGGSTDKWSSPWGQSLTLVSAIAEFPRELLTNIYFLREVRLDDDELMDAMDVCDDGFVVAWKDRSAHRVRDRAKEELTLLKEFRRTDWDSRAKCEAIVLLLRGDGGVAIRSTMDAAERATEAQHSQAPPATVNPIESR